MDFRGVALITGAASGIGSATAVLYAKEGCGRIAIADYSSTKLAETKQQMQAENADVNVLEIFVDVRDEQSVCNMVDTTLKTFGRLDYCANVAGILRFGDTSILKSADFEDVYQVNLRGVFLCSKYEIKAMIQQDALECRYSPFPARGAIVNVASEAGLMGNGDIPAYVASKHGVIGLSKSDGRKFAKDGVRVNAVCPGTVDTALLNSLPDLAGADPKTREEKRIADYAIGRLGLPEEIAQSIIWLTSGRSSFVTGTVLSVHGGLRNR